MSLGHRRMHEETRPSSAIEPPKRRDDAIVFKAETQQGLGFRV